MCGCFYKILNLHTSKMESVKILQDTDVLSVRLPGKLAFQIKQNHKDVSKYLKKLIEKDLEPKEVKKPCKQSNSNVNKENTTDKVIFYGLVGMIGLGFLHALKNKNNLYTKSVYNKENIQNGRPIRLG